MRKAKQTDWKEECRRSDGTFDAGKLFIYGMNEASQLPSAEQTGIILAMDVKTVMNLMLHIDAAKEVFFDRVKALPFVLRMTEADFLIKSIDTEHFPEELTKKQKGELLEVIREDFSDQLFILVAQMYKSKYRAAYLGFLIDLARKALDCYYQTGCLLTFTTVSGVEEALKQAKEKYMEAKQWQEKDIKNLYEYITQELYGDLELTKSFLYEQKPEPQITMIEYIMRTLSVQLQTDFLIDVLVKDNIDLMGTFFYIPKELRQNEEGEEVCIDDGDSITVDFARDIVISRPRERKRLINGLLSVKQKGFIYSEVGHGTYHLNGLGFSYVYDGFHSQSAAISLRTGTVQAKVLHIERLFPYIDIYKGPTGKLFWKNIKTEKMAPEPVHPLFAAIYMLGRRKYFLENGMEI